MVNTLHPQDNRSMLGQGILIFVYLAVLTGLEFLVAISFEVSTPSDRRGVDKGRTGCLLLYACLQAQPGK